MDILAVLRFVLHHNDKVFGVLVALFLVTSILLLIRSLTEKADSGASASASAASVDMKSIEKAMRNVLGSTAVTVSTSAGAATPRTAAPVPSTAPVEGAAPADSGNPLENEIVSQLLKEREQQVEDLTKDLEKVRAELKVVRDETAGLGPTFELESKIADLQARLAEYEIIEDDIADLSIYKEENERLKGEVGSLRSQLEQARLEQAAAPKSSGKIAAGSEIDLKFEKAEKFELDPNDDVMKAFAQAVGTPAPPLLPVATDTSVMATAEMFALSVDDDVMKQFAEATGTQVVGDPVKPAESAPETTAPEMIPETAPASADDPQAAIDAIFNQAKSESPAAASTSVDDPQAAIDAIFNQAKSESPAAASTSADDPQAAIDAIFNQAKSESPAAASTSADDPQAAIDAIFNQAKSESSAATGKPAVSDDGLPDLSEVAAQYEQSALAEATPEEVPAAHDEVGDFPELPVLDNADVEPKRQAPDEAQLTAMLDHIKVEPIDDPQARIDEMLAQAREVRTQQAKRDDVAPPEEAADVSEALSESLNKEKMLSELESLDMDAIQDQGDVLEGALDTDKLLHEAEVAGITGAAAVEVAAAAAPQEEKKPAVEALAPEDDLLAEFTDDGKA